MGKIVLIIISVIIISVMIKSSPDSAAYARPVVLQEERTGKGIKKIEFMTLFDSNKPFSSLAKQDYYTVVEGYIDSCAICKRLEAGFPAFLNKRKDVLIRRVHFPENGMNVSFSGQDQATVEKQAEEYNRKIKSYDFCSTPHVEIYDPNGQVIVADSCTKKPATVYLQRWMTEE